MDQQIQSLFQNIHKFEPQLSLNSQVQQDELFNILNSMSRKLHNVQYDFDTFLELYQRAQQISNYVTIYSFLDVHLQAVDILNQRVVNQQQDIVLLKNFTQDLNRYLQKPNDAFNNRMVTEQYLNINRIIVSGSDVFQIQPFQIRLVDEQQRESQFPLIADNQGYICQPKQRISVNNLYQQFTIEVIDQYSVVAYAQMSVYHLGIFNSNPVRLFVYFTDQFKRDLTITVEGQVEISNLEYANSDLKVLKQEEIRLSDELMNTQEQLRSLNFPFETVQGSYRQTSNQGSFLQGGYPNTLAQNANPGFYSDTGFGGVQALQTNQHVAVQGGIMHTSANEECDFDSKSLVRNIHYLLIIYLIVAVIFCIKRSMFLDATIAISFLAVLHRAHQLQTKIADVLKLFIGLFATTTALDLAWLIVYFPSWNRDSTSEDQGAQGVLRIIILGGSLLFMIYKVLLIVAVFFLHKDFGKQQEVVQKSIENFLIGNEATRVSHNPTVPNTASRVQY
ncbi:transmembrane protein, putative (macronuclear) [Tetrahymena thermophila SB210]|uniref:Transmembrane protein, putative n=1 Tax=Tetrahymena thermophila (strain SB210) TaxID=312017 RepID=Q24GJ1_TETTS|nr:transmembrane protein, putative [Tetrahymena thermophila SB210]EAS06880.3 transmembrane protein, putative [Tetrahymena thermophila SB210]|eukprot:XP_001027122.3 transmembrane protein, putative [Tetrahymena thermophila SB210]